MSDTQPTADDYRSTKILIDALGAGFDPETLANLRATMDQHLAAARDGGLTHTEAVATVAVLLCGTPPTPGTAVHTLEVMRPGSASLIRLAALLQTVEMS